MPSSESNNGWPQPDEPVYEQPDTERPASAAPTEQQLERELPAGRHARRGGHDPYAALRFSNYRFFAGMVALAVIAGQTQMVAVKWHVYQETHSAMSLGWLGGVMALPILVLALPAGHVADVFSRRRVMLVTHFISLLCAIGLAALSALELPAHSAVWAVYGLVLLGNAGATFGRPARAALLPQLVPTNVFPNAVTWNSSTFETASVIGPALGGFLCWRSVTMAFMFSAACWACTLVAIYRLPDFSPPERAERGFPRTGDLIAGVRFVWRSKLLLGAMTLDMLAVLLGGATFLLPIFAERLGVGAWGFGFLQAAPSIGAIPMAITLAHARPFRRAGRALLLSVAAFGAATIVFGLSRNFVLSFAMLVLVGAFDNISVVVRHTLIQLLTPDAMRGRVSAVNQVFIGSSNEIGGLESGMTAAWFGPVASVIIGGVGTIMVVLGVATVWPQVRRLGALQDVRADDVVDPRGFEVVQAAQDATSIR